VFPEIKSIYAFSLAIDLVDDELSFASNSRENPAA